MRAYGKPLPLMNTNGTRDFGGRYLGISAGAVQEPRTCVRWRTDSDSDAAAGRCIIGETFATSTRTHRAVAKRSGNSFFVPRRSRDARLRANELRAIIIAARKVKSNAADFPRRQGGGL